MKRLFFRRSWALGLIVFILLATACVGGNSANNAIPKTPTQLIKIPSDSPAPAETKLPPSLPAWVTTPNSSLANQVRVILIDQSGNLWAGGLGGLTRWEPNNDEPTTYVISSNSEHTNIVALNQTPDGAMWVGTFGNGVTRINDASWQSYTTENGLQGNYVISQTVSASGEIWLNTKKTEYDYDPKQEFHFARFDGNQWINEVGGGFSWIFGLPNGSIVGAIGDTGVAKQDSRIGIYDGDEWIDLGLTRQTINAVTVSPDGTIWAASRNSIFLYANQMWRTTIPPWAGKDSASVSSIAVAEDGTAWFGLSFGAGDFGNCGLRSDFAEEYGVYRYDGTTWTHFTTEDGLVDNKICAIALDSNDNPWFGSFDKGVSYFDGNEWTSYVIP